MHSDESACSKSGHLGLDPDWGDFRLKSCITPRGNPLCSTPTLCLTFYCVNMPHLGFCLHISSLIWDIVPPPSLFHISGPILQLWYFTIWYITGLLPPSLCIGWRNNNVPYIGWTWCVGFIWSSRIPTSLPLAGVLYTFHCWFLQTCRFPPYLFTWFPSTVHTPGSKAVHRFLILLRYSLQKHPLSSPKCSTLSCLSSSIQWDLWSYGWWSYLEA